MSTKMGSFKNRYQSNMLSREISEFHHRGFASALKIQTILNSIREQEGIKHLKNLDESKVQEVAREIAERVRENDLTGKTGATYISMLNQVIDYVNHFFDKEIEQLKYSDFDIHKSVDYNDKSVSEQTHINFQNFLQKKFEQIKDEKYQALQHAVKLQRELGLRFRESAGLNIKTIEKAIKTGKLELSRQDWTKNARERTIEIQTPEQRSILEKTRDFLKDSGKNNLAGGKDWKEHKPISSFRNFADRLRQDFNNQKKEQYSFHGERHAWAQSQYSAKWEPKTGIEIQSPIKYYSKQLEANGRTGSNNMKFYDAVKNFDIKPFKDYIHEQLPGISFHELREIDQEIRLSISEELGHSRIDITNTYLGHP